MDTVRRTAILGMPLIVLNILHSIRSSAASWPDAAWPDASTTGTSGSLTNVPGSLTSGTGWAWDAGDELIEVTGTGATLSGLDVSGPILIKAANVTISNCRVTTSEIFGMNTQANNTLIEDCEVIGSGNGASVGMNGIWLDSGGRNCTVGRCDISGCENGIMISAQNSIIQDNYIHDLIPEDIGRGADPHTDGIQLFANECDGAIIRGNNVIAPHTHATSAIIMGANKNLLITHNRFRGGYAVFRIYMDNSNTYTNNRVGDLSEVGGARLLTDNGGTGTPTFSGNVNDDTGLPLVVWW